MSNLEASPLGPPSGFNWVYLVELLICGVLSLFFLFYFNRLFATIISYGIRAYTWHKYRAYVDITSLQISPLGGRIFFKTVRYHAHNITVLVHDGHITWRYWLRQVQEADIFEENDGRASLHKRPKSSSQSSNEKQGSNDSTTEDVEDGSTKRKSLPCRISVKVSGVEAFIYNRSPSYDAIIEAAMRHTRDRDEGAASIDLAHAVSTASDGEALAQAIPSWLRVLPIHLQCKKAAAAIGNENTTSVITAKVEHTTGQINAGSASALDLYKLLFDFEFKNILVAMKPNADYKCPQSNAAHSALRQEIDRGKTAKHSFFSIAALRSRFSHLRARELADAGSVRTASISHSVPPTLDGATEKIPGASQWHGLSRYLTDDTPDEQAEWRDVEYAKASTLVDCPQVNMRFYWEIPGHVTGTDGEQISLLSSSDEGSPAAVSEPPGYGIDLIVHGGTITYGPWADRERVVMQRVFFPAACVDATPVTMPAPGELRLATIFKLFLSIEEDVTLRIPIRETSKDHRWKGRAQNGPYRQRGDKGMAQHSSNPKKSKAEKTKKTQTTANAAADTRPYGWLDITVKPDSTVNYTMDMYAQQHGFRNTLDLDIKSSEITSSVNHALLWRTGGLTMVGDLSNPLPWNTLRDWPFKIVCNDMELFILRDHLFLIIDLVSDWGAGAVPDFYTFVPFRYTMDITLNNFIMYLNTNDANIINDPIDFEMNDFLTLEGESLKGLLGIPLLNFRPKKNEITFDVVAQKISMRMLSSARSTFRSFLEDKRVATLPELTLVGCFESNQVQQPGLSDTLRMDIQGSGFTMQAYGFLLRHLINVKENYFGDYIHFKTLEEFQSAGETYAEANEQTASITRPRQITELDVLLSIVVKDAALSVPTNLYTAKEFLKAEVPQVLVDLRVGSYYLDLAVDVAPVSIATGTASGGAESTSSSSTQLYIGHAGVYGHRAFGLPPAEAPYASTWEIDIGKVAGELQPDFLRYAISAAKALIFTFDDKENALPIETPLAIFDASFVQVRTDSITLWLHAGPQAIRLATDPITVNTNDWANEIFSQHTNVIVPNLSLACVSLESATNREDIRNRGSTRAPAKTHALLQTTLVLDVVGRKTSFKANAARQQSFIRSNDLRTGRVPFLQRSGAFWTNNVVADDDLPGIDPPAMPYPPYPAPIDSTGQKLRRPASIKSLLVRKLLPGQRSASPSPSVASNRAPRHALPGESPLKQSLSSASRQSSVSRTSDSSRQASMGAVGHPSGELALGMASSSPYMAPQFPLNRMAPDEDVAPAFKASTSLPKTWSADSLSSDVSMDVDVDDDIAQTSITIQCPPGIRVYCEPLLGEVVAFLTGAIQPKSAEDVMDTFQTDTMADVLAEQRRRQPKSTVTQISLQVPSIAARVAQPDGVACQDIVLNANLTNLRLLTRIRTPSQGTDQGALSFYTVLDDLSLNLRQPDNKTALEFAIQEVTVLLAFAHTRNVRVTVKDITARLAADAARFFAGLPLAIAPLVARLSSSFERITEQSTRRLRLMLYQLTQLGEHVVDPMFLTKMTYILRAFPDHFRNQESWKVLMRCRTILKSLPPTILHDLEHTLEQEDVIFPEDAPRKMLESWRQWRNWDVIDVGKTLAFRKIFDHPVFNKSAESKPLPVSLTWTQDSVRFMVLHEEHESRIMLTEINCAVEVDPARAPTGLMLVEENKRTRTRSHVHAASTTIDLHWSLLNITEQILPEILNALPPPREQVPATSTTQVLDTDITRREFHLVISTDTGSVGVRTPNVSHIAHAEGLKASLLGTTQAEEPWGVCSSALLNAKRAGTQLHAGKITIWQSLLQSPSIYVDYLRSRPGVEMPPTLNLAIAYQEAKLEVQEQLPGILRIVDAVIADEVAQVVHLIKALDKQKPTDSTPTEELNHTVSGPTTAPKIHVALLAGQLVVDISLLQSLKYHLSGTAASVRLAPSLTETRSMTIDFETGRLQHSLVNVSRDQQHEQRIVEVPPVNGHIVLHNTADEKRVSVLTTIGRLEIDAEALQAVATTLNKREVQNVITAIKDGIDEIQERVEAVVPRGSKAKSSSPGDPFRYDVRLTLAGIRVAASTPQAPGRAAAAFELGIGMCTALASNEQSLLLGSTPWFPEVRSTLRDIGAKLVVTRGKTIFPAGNITLVLAVQLSVHRNEAGEVVREMAIKSQKFEVNIYPETAAITVDVINQLQDRLKHLDLSGEVEYLRSLRHRKAIDHQDADLTADLAPLTPTLSTAELLSMKVKVALTDVVMTWLVHADQVALRHAQVEDLVLTLAAIELNANGLRDGKLTIRDFQLQMVPRGSSKTERALNSALLPEVVFSLAHWTSGTDRSLAFKASGKPLDVRLDSRFVVPFNGVKRSIDYAVDKFRAGTANWETVPTTTGAPRKSMLNDIHFASLTAEADFAGAKVYLQGSMPDDTGHKTYAATTQGQSLPSGHYGQFAPGGGVLNTTLTSPGISLKLQYENKQQSTVQAEVKVASSSNMLLPTVVPLVREISKSIKEVMQSEPVKHMAAPISSSRPTQSTMFDEAFATANPEAIFGKTKVNFGLRIARQEFGLTCQPVAKIDAKAELDDFYFTVSTIDSSELGHFFAISASLSRLSAKVKHVYSREPTFTFDMDSVVLSLMNSKHFGGANGVAAILKINPTKTAINGKQLQDLLLFREIWLPPEMRGTMVSSPQSPESTDVLMQRYQTVAASAAFPWHATVAISELSIDLDLGQSLGKSCFRITDLWASSQKTSDSEQNLCVGLEEVAMHSQGRMSGFVNMSGLAVRTSIHWPETMSSTKTPSIQASIGFARMRAKAAFDYQAFAFGDIEGLDFLMYNVHDERHKNDRLVAILDCSKVYVFCTSTSPAQAFGLYQAVDRLIQEKQLAFAQSLKDIEKHLHRGSIVTSNVVSGAQTIHSVAAKSRESSAITLHTDVVVSLGNICVGAFPGTFFDSQMFKAEANDLQARFAVGIEQGKVRSGLGMTIGQLQVALAAVKKVAMPKNISDLGVDEVITAAVESKGGVILKVPRVIASMETWQTPGTNNIEYIFKSLFEGKVDIGWNLSRINLIRGMWSTHSRALANRMGKALPESAVKITADLEEKNGSSPTSGSKNKITAEVNLPQSRYEYTALEPPIIETPQLRDMGEATPPLEWIGLNRDRLPNITHQVIIVALLEIAREVEDAYGTILGTS